MNNLIKIGVTFLLSICCLTPLNVKAEFIVPTSNTMYIYDYEGNRVTTCTFPSGLTNGACGTDWRDNDTIGFGSFILSTAINVPNNYTVEYSLEVEIEGVNFSEGVIQSYFQYTFGGYSHLEAETTRTEIYNNHIIKLTSFAKFTNNTGQNVTSMELKYTNLAGSYLDLTNVKVNLLTINIYDEQGRLIQKIENGINLIHDDLNGINGLLNKIHTEIYYQSGQLYNMLHSIKERQEVLFNEVYVYFVQLFSNITSNFDRLISAIRGDDKEVSSKEDLDNTTNDLNSTVNEYDDIESGLVDDFNTNLGAIRPNNDLITNNDFIKTSTFVATQMTRIYESNDIIRMTITFGLIIGLAFTIIGISVRR